MANAEWGSEEFEDLVARGLIMCFEDRVFTRDKVRWSKIRHKESKIRAKHHPTQKDIKVLREVGPYFNPTDKVTKSPRYDPREKDLPGRAAWSFKRDDHYVNPYWGPRYLSTCVLEKIDKLPRKAILPYARYAAYYRMAVYSAYQETVGGFVISIGISENGDVYSVFTHKSDRYGKATTTMAANVLKAHSDRQSLWNVQAQEHNAKATFGVYPEQIKSLLYARELPLTATGRKRPILHWVRAHRRRMQEGIEVDVEKHLRGIDEFVMNGTKFQITRPIKGENHE